ncbi:MAG: type II toxin-antitoxin system Phd/YefM family antitoxin [Gammaproteobacteria bacterium]|nr:type II toxin-antitoxin system Phd/YefM family antitoxin [Gammaproteobacteria bacterium]
MGVTTPILSAASTSITELKRNPMAVISQSDGEPVVVLNHNKPTFYCVPAATYEAMVDQLEDQALLLLALGRQDGREVEVLLDDL